MEQETVNNHLLKNNIRPLRKRALIYNYLASKKNHPTVETIYKELLPSSPTLSKTTVYNVLNLFLDNNLVQAINIEGNELRYDADISTHGHFKCDGCGRIFDFLINDAELPQIPLKGFTTTKAHYYLEGKCIRCSSPSAN